MRFTTMSFSAVKAGNFEITWRGLRAVVKIIDT
jgi:hypothetical protein